MKIFVMESFPFLDLPLDIRLELYDLLLISTFDVHRPKPMGPSINLDRNFSQLEEVLGINSSFLTTCRQICTETTSVP